MRDPTKLLAPSLPPSSSSPRISPRSTPVSLTSATPSGIHRPPGCGRLDTVGEGSELLDPIPEVAPVEGFGSVATFVAAAEHFMVFIQETRAKAEEACRLAVLMQKAAAAAAAGGGSDVAVALEICKKAAVATAAVGGGSSDATATSKVCKVTNVMHKEVAAPTDLIKEGAAEEEAYQPQPPILIPAPIARDFGGNMRGLTQSTMLANDSDHMTLFEKKASVGQIGIEEMRGKGKDVSSEEGSSEEVEASDDDVSMVIGGDAQDPYDDSGIEELVQDQGALEKLPTKPTKLANPNSLLRIPKGITESPSPPISRGAVGASRLAESPLSTSGNGMVSRHGEVGCAVRALGTSSWEELAGCSDGRAATHRWGTSSLAGTTTAVRQGPCRSRGQQLRKLQRCLQQACNL
uniref:Uncharacterized protein n=1 Tax=Oryza glumipatula TaxID=40148 RepID=A0A0D9ZC81_9ORYZ